MLSLEEEKRIKEQVIKIIEKSYPEDKKEFAVQKILSMSSEEFENFLSQNNLNGKFEGNNCIFCAIADKKVDSKVLDENDDAIAVLEINPMSKGHVIIIPKEHLSSEKEFPKSVKELTEKVLMVIKTKLKPKKMLTNNSNAFGHEIVNVIPIYTDENSLKKYKATEEELSSIQKLFVKREKKVMKKTSKPKVINEKIWMPKRIP